MTSENPFVELTWRGQRVGRVKLDAPSAGAPGFLYYEAPLPVGAVLEVAPEGGVAKRVRVVGVVEQEGGRDGQPPPPPGMKVVWVEPVAPPPIPADAAPAAPVEPVSAAETTDPIAVADGAEPAKPKRTRRKPSTGDPRPPRLGGKGSKKKT